MRFQLLDKKKGLLYRSDCHVHFMLKEWIDLGFNNFINAYFVIFRKTNKYQRQEDRK